MAIPPDLRFLVAIGILGVVMLTIDPVAAGWLALLLILATVTWAEQQGRAQGRSLIGDILKMFGFEEEQK